MPEKKTIERAEKAKRAGKSGSTQAGEFVREEMHRMRGGEGAAQSSKQAVAIGLSKARRAGVEVKPPKKGATSAKTRKRAQSDAAKGAQARKARTSGSRSVKKTSAAPKGEGRATASSSSRSKSRAGKAAKSRAGKNAAH